MGICNANEKASHYPVVTIGTFSNFLRQSELTNGLQALCLCIWFTCAPILLVDYFFLALVHVENSHPKPSGKCHENWNYFRWWNENGLPFPSPRLHFVSLVRHVHIIRFLLLLALLFAYSFQLCQPNECHLLLCIFTVLHFAHFI